MSESDATVGSAGGGNLKPAFPPCEYCGRRDLKPRVYRPSDSTPKINPHRCPHGKKCHGGHEYSAELCPYCGVLEAGA